MTRNRGPPCQAETLTLVSEINKLSFVEYCVHGADGAEDEVIKEWKVERARLRIII